MDIREKLVELLRNGKKEHIRYSRIGNPITSIFEPMVDDKMVETLADHLIANGVTVQEWISVEDELPKEQGFYRVYHKNSKAICDRFYYKDCPDLFVNVRDDPITHWKPIEQPPKGE